MQNILIRADSSSEIGLGHIMRDLVLAQQSPKDKITFATQALNGNINNKILEADYNLQILQSNTKEELIKLIKKLHIDLLIIDHYKITDKIEKYIKEKTNVKIFVLDDTYEKHHCDILLNHNIGASQKKYKNLVPKTCELRCGEKYTLLREEFYKQKRIKRKSKISKIKTVFVAMGGVDHTNINPQIIKVLSRFKKLQLHLITSSSNKNLKALNKSVENKKWVNIHINSTKIAKLMKQSDFAIISPSVTANEAIFMELPFIAIKTAQNQSDVLKYLKRKNFFTLNSFKSKKLYQYMKLLMDEKCQTI